MTSAHTGSTPGGEPFAHLLRFGLARALQAHSEELRAQHPNLALELDLVDDEGLLDETTCRVLYRVFVETMANILRGKPGSAAALDTPTRVQVHYAPSAAVMRLEIRAPGGAFSIKDDWARFQRGAQGVMGLKPRLTELGGDLQVHAPSGEETVIQADAGLRAQ